MPVRRRPLLLSLLAVPAAALALPAAPAQAATYNCDASALRGTVLGSVSLEPTTANRGATSCVTRTGGLTDLLPAPLSASAIVARTVQSGTADRQAALAVGGLADLRIAGLPQLPLTLPIDQVLATLPTLPSIPVPLLLQPLLGASLSLDVRPALTALLPSGRLPDVELVGVQAAMAYAGARCVDGRAAPFGTSSVAGVRVLGQEVVPGAALDRTVTLVDTASVDPSNLDPIALLPTSAVTSILGSPLLEPVLNTVLKPAIQAALDALPTIEVPATLANVKLTAGAKVESGGALSQQALRVQASILGQSIADVVVGEARVATAGVDCTAPTATPSAATTPSSTDLALQCTKRRLVLQDVVRAGSRVRLLGAADKKLAGQKVTIRFLATGRAVATATVRKDGSFSATAPLPSRAVRDTNKARYQAQVGREKSLDLKLARRMVLRGVAVRKGKVTISGRVVGPLTAPASSVTVTRRVSCKRSTVVARVRPRRDGTFRVTVDAPEGQSAAVYRLGTFVRKTTRNPKRFPTFTLPRAVDLG